jgi:DNA-binding beta-propeller fold protein YncE
MKTKSSQEKIHTHLPCLRLAAAGTLILAAAGLAATAMHPPEIPWAVPTAHVGHNALGTAVDPGTNTVYVGNGLSDTVSVIDGSKCNSGNSSGCAPLAAIPIGKIPTQALFDSTTDTIYVLLAGGDGKSVAVVDGRHCNAQDTSGCKQARVALATTASRICGGGCADIATAALDLPTHSLYVGDAEDGPVSIINTAVCNGSNTSGCTNSPIVTATQGDGIAVDHSSHSVYVTGLLSQTVSVFDGSTCNALDQSTCAQPPAATFLEDLAPSGPGIVDETTHTYYLPLSAEGLLGQLSLLNTLTCNATNTSGCGAATPTVQVGSAPSGDLIFDPATQSVYVLNQSSSSISVLNSVTCNSTTQSGCSQVKQIATGFNPFYDDFNSVTHTLYVASQDTDTVWALDTSNCNALETSGCTPFAPTTRVGAVPTGIANNPDTQSVYVANQFDNNVSVIDSSACNRSHNNCQQNWPTVAVGTSPRSLQVNRSTNTIYVPNRDDGTVSVIDGAHCNSNDSSGCGQTPVTTVVGTLPQEVAIDQGTNTIYVANQTDNTVSVIDGTHCQGTDTSGCNQSWPTIPVGAAPQALAFNPTSNTLYVANTDDSTVSVISGKIPIATVSVGNGPRSIGFVLDKNTIFVGNRSDLTVSVIDGSTCNAANTTGCSRIPPAILVGQFPKAAGTGNYFNGRRIVVDQHNDAVFIPTVGDSDVAMLDGSVCTAAHPKDCNVQIVPKRMGGFSVFATLDELSGTVYVVNDDDGTVSLFPSSR